MIYYLYEIKNNLNGKIYVGVHKTHDMNDGYMGSGKIIQDAIKKYGKAVFTKTIIESFTTLEEMFAKEKEIVNDEFLLRNDVYNLRRGGTGGFGEYHTAKAKLANTHLKKQREEKYYKEPSKCFNCGACLGYKQRKGKFCSKSCSVSFNNNKRSPRSEESKNRTSQSLRGVPKTEEHKRAISYAMQKGA